MGFLIIGTKYPIPHPVVTLHQMCFGLRIAWLLGYSTVMIDAKLWDIVTLKPTLAHFSISLVTGLSVHSFLKQKKDNDGLWVLRTLAGQRSFSKCHCGSHRQSAPSSRNPESSSWCSCAVIKALSSNLDQWPWVTSLHCLFCPTPPLREETKKRRVPLLLSHSTGFSWFKHTYWRTYAKGINPDAGSLRQHILSVKLNVKTWTNFVATITVQRSSYTVEQSLENFLKHTKNKFLWRRKHYCSKKYYLPSNCCAWRWSMIRSPKCTPTSHMTQCKSVCRRVCIPSESRTLCRTDPHTSEKNIKFLSKPFVS